MERLLVHPPSIGGPTPPRVALTLLLDSLVCWRSLPGMANVDADHAAPAMRAPRRDGRFVGQSASAFMQAAPPCYDSLGAGPAGQPPKAARPPSTQVELAFGLCLLTEVKRPPMLRRGNACN